MSWKLSMATAAAPTVFGPLLYAGRVLEGLSVAADLGYDGIEISLRDVTELDVAALQRELATRRLSVSALGSGRIFLEEGLCFSDPDSEVRRAAVSRLGGHVDLGATVGAVVIVGLVRGARPAGDGTREWARIVGCVRECADYAAAKSVRLVVEAINRYETLSVNTAAELLALLEAVDRPNVGALLDTFHMNIEEVSVPAAIRAAGARLGYVHLADSNRWAPGFGHLDFPEIQWALRDIDYRGWLSAEILPRPDDFQAAAQAWRFMSSLRRG
ncbi:MAG: sugar phosphate isomerase/epimerase [Thermoleophilia bacterium]|nr:sugar phosphate isomerase/epimerase [Thermoleophilia bacterium]